MKTTLVIPDAMRPGRFMRPVRFMRAFRFASKDLTSSRRCCALAGALVFLFGSSWANAGVIDNIFQSGSNVVSAYSGSVNTSGLTPLGNATCAPAITPGTAFECFDPSSAISVPLYSGVTGPNSLGVGSAIAASSQSGNGFAVNGNAGFLSTFTGYVSGSALAGSLTWNSTTIAGLGLTPGTYTYTWGSGATADSLVINIGAAAVPEPSSLSLVLVAGLALVVFRAARRARLSEIRHQ